MNVARTAQIRRALLRARPEHLKVASGDAIRHIEVNTRNWQDLAETVDALDPDLVEMLDKDGKTLRALKPTSDDDLTEEKQAKGKGPTASVGVDAETERFKIYAAHLADAHKFVQIAFDTLAGIVNAVTGANAAKDRFIEQLQRAYGRALQDNAELIAETPGEEGDPMEKMMQMIAVGAIQGNQERKMAAAVAGAAAAATKKPTPTNGKTKA